MGSLSRRLGDWGARPDRRTQVLSAGVVFVAVVSTGLDDGGFFPGAWPWLIGLFVAVAGLALASGSWRRPSRAEAIVVVGLAGLLLWTLVSAAWSSDAGSSLREAERTLLYATVAAAIALSGAWRRSAELVGGVLLGIGVVVAVALASYLAAVGDRVPDRFENFLLFEPIGYANAMGLLAVFGILLAVGLCAAFDQAVLRGLGAALAVLCAAALTLTSSRGAWLALCVGLAAMIVLEPRRARLAASLLVVLPGAAGAVAVSAESRLLSTTAPLASAWEGRRVGLLVAGIALLSAGLSRFVPRLVRVLTSLPRRVVATLIILAALAPASGSWALADRIPDPSGGDRRAYWRVAWDEYERNPVLGSGAGTFHQAWARYGTTGTPVQDAHSLYLEMLAELGPIGLALVAVSLLAPLLAGARRREYAVVPACAGVLAAYAAHAALDWDWELPALTLSTLFVGLAILDQGRSAPGPAQVS